MQNKIRLVVFDFDGVFTDNSVYVNEHGEEAVVCSRSDGLGIRQLELAGIKAIVLTAEKNKVVDRRCEKLGIRCIKCEPINKLHTLVDFLASHNQINEDDIGSSNICYVGNDTPDLTCMKWVGFPIAVKNSYSSVLKVAKYVTKREGGKGAVREVCELICKGDV